MTTALQRESEPLVLLISSIRVVVSFRRNDFPLCARRHGDLFDLYLTECCSTGPESSSNCVPTRCLALTHQILDCGRLKCNDGPNALPGVHQMQGVIDFLDRHRVRRHLVDLEGSLKIDELCADPLPRPNASNS